VSCAFFVPLNLTVKPDYDIAGRNVQYTLAYLLWTLSQPDGGTGTLQTAVTLLRHIQMFMPF
jgi:hypothetical protein